MKLLILLLLVSGCGVNGTENVVQSGTSTTQISVVFGFINQIEALCQQDTLQSDYPDTVTYNKAVADCTFSKLSTINLTQVCNTPGLTPEQIATCQGLSVP